jgi:hypothetical protein
MKEKKEKKLQSFWIDEYLIEQFDVITSFKKVGKSDLINELIRNYVITNKADVNEVMLNYWKNNIEE